MSSIDNLKTIDPFADADADEQAGETKQSYIHIRIQQRNGRKTLTTVQGLPKKFDQKKILKVIKKKFACNGTIVVDTEMGEVIQLQGDQRKDVQEFLIDKDGLELDSKTIKAAVESGFVSGRKLLQALMVDMVLWPNLSNIGKFASYLKERQFSLLAPLKRNSNAITFLKGTRAAEKSIRVISKEGARIPSDVGLLDKTFITPTGINLPSIFLSPKSAWLIQRTRILSRARDFFSLILSKLTSPKVSGFWNRTFNLNRSSLVPTATALHSQMYTAFAEGDELALQKICLEGIHNNLRFRIANRSQGEKVVWELLKYNKQPKLVSNRAAKTPIDGMVIRQAVVQICSRQKLIRYSKTPNGQLEQVKGCGKEKDVVEYVVIQRIYEQWQPKDWMVWGTAKETSLDDIQEWNRI